VEDATDGEPTLNINGHSPWAIAAFGLAPGSGNADAIKIAPQNAGKAINALGQVYVAPTNTDDDAIKLVPNGTGSGIVGSSLAIPKGIAYSNFMFKMVLATDNKSPKTGATPACTISQDGGAFGACTNTPATEVSAGWYKIDLTDTEMTADEVVVKFTNAGANTVEFKMRLNP
jgi:hypothetical protein